MTTHTHGIMNMAIRSLHIYTHVHIHVCATIHAYPIITQTQISSKPQWYHTDISTRVVNNDTMNHLWHSYPYYGHVGSIVNMWIFLPSIALKLGCFTGFGHQFLEKVTHISPSHVYTYVGTYTHTNVYLGKFYSLLVCKVAVPYTSNSWH